MNEIRIVRAHALGSDEALARAQALAASLAAEYGLRYHWQAARLLHFRGSGVHGTLELGDAELSLCLTLGFLLWPLRPSLELAISERLDALLPG